jgi:heme/copper-type cytochrome/quinol oxidase subunit 4
LEPKTGVLGVLMTLVSLACVIVGSILWFKNRKSFRMRR